MSSRDAILGRIRSALAGDPPMDPPPAHEVWPRENPSADAMARRFTEELEAIGGEVHRVGSVEEARTKLAELLAEAGWKAIGGVDRPGSRELTAGLAPDRIRWIGPEGDAKQMAGLEAGLVEADRLLADTGTCMIACATAQDRLMCYLPPVCIVLARTELLAEHLPAVWEEIARRAADPELRGEFVFVTGPSRTADIEKILILGVHGPKRLIVLLVG